MEEKRMPTIVIILLTIVGTCLVGFGVWFGVNHFKGEEKPSTPDNSVDQPTTAEILKFPQNGGAEFLLNDLLELLPEGKVNENFKNLTYNKDGNLYKYDCENYESKCNLIKLTINNEVSINTTDYNDRTSKINLYKIGNYYVTISEHDYVAALRIYSEGREVLSTKATSRVFVENALLPTKPIIVNNRLYYVEYNGERLNDGTYNCRYGYIDLMNGINFVEIQSLKLKIDDYEDK